MHELRLLDPRRLDLCRHRAARHRQGTGVKRLCRHHGLYVGRRCPACDRMRLAKTAQRGYGSAHQRARRQLARSLPAPCGYCGAVIEPDEAWVAAHVVDGAPEYGYIPAHASCNERAKVRKGPNGGGVKSLRTSMLPDPALPQREKNQ